MMKSKLAVIVFSGATLAAQAGFVFAAPSDATYVNTRATQSAEEDTSTQSQGDAMWYRSSQGVPCCD